MSQHTIYYEKLAAAFVRGKLYNQPVRETHPKLFATVLEGLYVKIEEDGIVKERYKYVRSGFLQAVLDSESHWQDRPILPNQLKQDARLF